MVNAPPESADPQKDDQEPGSRTPTPPANVVDTDEGQPPAAAAATPSAAASGTGKAPSPQTNPQSASLAPWPNQSGHVMLKAPTPPKPDDGSATPLQSRKSVLVQ